MVHGRGTAAPTAVAAIRASYAAGVTDEFVEPWVIGEAGEGRLRDGDGLVFWNFRPDRARQLTRALAQAGFDEFDRGPAPPMPAITTMTRYNADFPFPAAFEADNVRAGLAEAVSGAGLRQLHVAETEKYAHVTYFFNGGREEAFPGEERTLVPSPQHVPTYDQAPEMSALGVKDAVILGADDPAFSLLVVNFANADMVGHTGVIPAAVTAIQTVDQCLAEIRPAVARAGGLLAVTADHGNSEVMLEPDGSPNTAHTTNPVPLWIDRPGLTLAEGKLGDVAPTLSTLMGWEIPPAMTGDVLVG
jgi:2,3-bisphosphoglycerate-independent phosphoglycerate mutase